MSLHPLGRHSTLTLRPMLGMTLSWRRTTFWSDYPGIGGGGTGKHAIAGDGVGDTQLPHPGQDFDNSLLISPFQPFITVGIDIKPGSDPNSINMKSKGTIPGSHPLHIGL